MAEPIPLILDNASLKIGDGGDPGTLTSSPAS